MKVKKKLRDVTPEEFARYKNIECKKILCSECIFRKIDCANPNINITSWVFYKELYGELFLNQEIEIETVTKVLDILTKEEKEYLKAVIRPFKDRVNYITKKSGYDNIDVECIKISLRSVVANTNDVFFLPLFYTNTMYKKNET